MSSFKKIGKIMHTGIRRMSSRFHPSELYTRTTYNHRKKTIADGKSFLVKKHHA